MTKHVILISGKSSTGKSCSLMNLEKPEGVMYLCTEASKPLPFASKFKIKTITDALQVEAMFQKAESMKDIHTIVVDSLSMLMEQFESQHVLTSPNTMAGWSDYQQFFKRLMHEHVAKSTKNIIFTTHVQETMNEAELVMETKATIKGALKGTGIEAYFTTVVSTKKVPLTKLENYSNKYLNITEDDKIVGYKHCYQCRPTKETINERIRSPLALFSQQETFIDSDANKLLKKLDEYYS